MKANGGNIQRRRATRQTRQTRPTASSHEQTSGLTGLASRTALLILLTIFLPAAVFSQSKTSLQVKTFDQSLKPLGNIEISINNAGYFMIGSKGTAIVELSASDTKIISIKVKDETLEPASWNVSKGVVEIVIRPKSYHVLHFVLRQPDGKGLPGASITYLGNSTIKSKSDQAGRFVLQLPVKENVKSADQFRVQDFQVTGLSLSDTESIVNVIRPSLKQTAPPQTQQVPVARQPRKNEIKGDVQRDKVASSESVQKYVLNMATLDTVSSLTSLYAMIRNTPMSSLSVNEKNILDTKFRELLEMERAGLNNSTSETSPLNEDIDTLPDEAVSENDSLQTREGNFEDKNAGDQLQSRQWQFGLAAIIVAFAILMILLIVLYSRLRERTLSLQQAKRKIDKDNESVDEIVMRQTRLLAESNREQNSFLNRSSQEMRTLLRSIIGFCKVIEHVPSRELVDRLESATATMDRVIDKLIDISQEPGNAEHVKVIDVINEVKNKQMSAERKSRITRFDSVTAETGSAPDEQGRNAEKEERPLQFKVNCADDMVLYTNRSLLEMVLNNLVENAIHFSTIKDASGPAIVEIDVITRGDMMELSVYDNGVGISKAVKPRVFNMYFTGHEEAPGNGLGLYAVKKGVVAMHGKVDIMTEEGVFTRVVVMIPKLVTGRRVPGAADKIPTSV